MKALTGLVVWGDLCMHKVSVKIKGQSHEYIGWDFMQ